MMSVNISDSMRKEIAELKRQLEAREHELECLIKNCPHQWSPVEADHIYTPSYKVEGDPEGVGGVDHRHSHYVEAKTEKRWKRTCKVCGLVQHTTETKKIVEERPMFDTQ